MPHLNRHPDNPAGLPHAADAEPGIEDYPATETPAAEEVEEKPAPAKKTAAKKATGG